LGGVDLMSHTGSNDLLETKILNIHEGFKLALEMYEEFLNFEFTGAHPHRLKQVKNLVNRQVDEVQNAFNNWQKFCDYIVSFLHFNMEWHIDVSNNTVRLIYNPPSGPRYTNLIPIPLFKHIVNSIVEQFDKFDKETITVKQLAEMHKEKIINESSYKMTPETVPRKVFDVLKKEMLLTNIENDTEILNRGEFKLVTNTQAIKQWLNENFE
jgi:hypothetical protein